jgi:serpin B
MMSIDIIKTECVADAFDADMNARATLARLTTSTLLAALLAGGCASHEAKLVAYRHSSAPAGLAFATKLYGQLRNQPGNLFLSPASLRMALAMTYAGARGTTATQLHDGLALGDVERTDADMADSLLRWGELSAGKTQLRVANQLWLQRGLSIEPAFAKVSGERYRAPIIQLDFSASEASRGQINRWVSDHSEHEIDALIEPGMIDEHTRLVLTNSVYFKADWLHKFDGDDTQRASFLGAGHDVRAQLMSQTGEFTYAEFAEGQLVELPYAAGDLVLDVLLPATPNGLARLEDALIAGALPRWLKQAWGAEVAVALPRFHSASRLRLGAPLAALGIAQPFTDGADFSGITRDTPLRLADVVHEAVIDVDERGTRVVAATAVSTAPTATMPRHFRADHPFVYLVRDKGSDEILFLGRLVDPSAR